MVTLARSTKRLALAFDTGSKLLKSRTVRHASQAVAKCKIIEGNNGERIFTSPYGDVDIPSVTIPEYVWANIQQWPNSVALVRRAI